MSTTFNFPANPTVGDLWTLPNGSVAQWDGTQWVSVDNSNISYPLALALGGTGAATAPQARINLGLNAATGEFIVQKDGTLAAPGLAFNSEPGLGWYRSSAGTINSVVGGFVATALDSFSASSTIFTVCSRSAGGNAVLSLSNNVTGSSNRNLVQLSQDVGSGSTLRTIATGSATRGNLTLDAPVVTATGVLQGGTNGPSLWVGAAENYLTMQGLAANTGWAWGWNRTNGALFWNNGGATNLLLFDSVGNAAKASGGTTWTVLSDKRAKTDIVDWDGGLDKVLSLRPRRFTRIDTGERSIGCIADEAEVGFGELIERKPGNIGDVEYPDRAELHIDPLFWALVNSVKTLNARLAALEQS